MGTFLLKRPIKENRDDRLIGEYETLDEAIEAAKKAHLDLDAAVIEKDGGQHPVTGWIKVSVAGGSVHRRTGHATT